MKILKRLLILLSIVFVLGLGAYYGAGYFVYEILTATTPECSSEFMLAQQGNAPSDFVARYQLTDNFFDASEYFMPEYEDVRFTSREDDVQLEGWFIPAPEVTDQTVIIVHGIASCRRDSTALIPAGMLHRNGFNVLMFDLRNFGDSEVTTGRLTAGNEEYNDVLGAFDYLLERGYSAENIGIMGISMGGGISVIAFANEPAIPALWLESPFSDIEQVVQDEFTRNGYPQFLIPAAFQISQLNGINFYANSPNEMIQFHNERPIFIVHGDEDVRVPISHSEELYPLAGNNAEYVVFEGYGHVEAIYTAVEYEELMVNFFEETLGRISSD